MKKIIFTGITDKSVQEKIQNYHQEFWNKVETWAVKPKCRKTITVNLNPRHKSCAGYAHYRKVSISLNYWMLYKNDSELRDTYGHELAHLIAQYIHHKRCISHHGPEWKWVMKNLGLIPTRCHSVHLEERKKN